MASRRVQPRLHQLHEKSGIAEVRLFFTGGELCDRLPLQRVFTIPTQGAQALGVRGGVCQRKEISLESFDSRHQPLLLRTLK